MKSSSKPVVCNLVFFFFLILTVTGHTEMKTRAEQPAVDATVKIIGAPGVQAPGIKGCLPAPVSTNKVRLQSLKTSGGSVYTRQLVTTADLPCFENSGTKATLGATTIAICAEATAKKGLNSFSWENGACTAYLAWRPQKRADCKDGGVKVVYVVTKPLTPFEGGKIIVSGEPNYDALPQVFLDISYQYDFCGFSSNMSKGYKLLINGSDVVMLPEGQTKYSLSLKIKCSTSVNISLWSVGADGKVNSNESQVTYPGGKPRSYYGLDNGGCLYDANRMEDYLGSLQYCNSKANGTLYFEKVDGETMAFLAALLRTSVPAHLSEAYVGLTWVGEGQWTWLGGLPQPSNDTIWAYAPLTGTWGCASVFANMVGWFLMARTNCTVQAAVFCYYPNP